MPKVQKQVSRKVGDKEYAKYVVVIPNEELERQGIKPGDHVKIVLKKINPSPSDKRERGDIDVKVKKIKKKRTSK
jgi:bifunctional DNA-binding transcriptional regulator/antitoxin component of YhaV-PrlF toxin-antitoxin module